MEAYNQNMISFKLEKGKFNYRIAGILIRDGKVLITKYHSDKKWYLPGGRADLLENSKTTVQREFKEELDCEIEVKDLKYMVEHSFHFNEMDYHEVCLIYDVELINGKIPHEDFETIEFGSRFFFKWVPIDELKNHPIKPEILKEGISIDSSFQHVLDI